MQKINKTLLTAYIVLCFALFGISSGVAKQGSTQDQILPVEKILPNSDKCLIVKRKDGTFYVLDTPQQANSPDDEQQIAKAIATATLATNQLNNYISGFSSIISSSLTIIFGIVGILMIIIQLWYNSKKIAIINETKKEIANDTRIQKIVFEKTVATIGKQTTDELERRLSIYLKNILSDQNITPTPQETLTAQQHDDITDIAKNIEE